MATITTEVDVDVDLDEFDDDELKAEMIRRGLDAHVSESTDLNGLIETMYHKYRCKQPIDEELRKLFYITIGRIA